jgi:outer membrane protein
MNKSIKLIIIFLSINSIVFGQNTMTLEEVINSYFERTNAAKINTIDKNIATSNFLLYKAGMKPQVSLNFQVPNYSKTSVQIVQPNGSIAFQSISQNNSLVGLQLLQAIPWTGGTFFAQSELRRFDDFSTDFNSYNGIPIRLGINIPVLGFNPYKWDKLIQPLELNAAISTYTFERENIKSNIVQLYFDVLIAQTAKQIAVTNKISHIRLDTIAVEKFELGKISREEKLQIETGLENSEIVLKQYQYDEVTSFNSLNSYLNGAQLDSTIKFVIPVVLIPAKINDQEIIALATRNYPQLLRNKINILEAQRNIVQGLKLITASVPIYTAVLVGQEVHSRSKISILSLLWRSS